MMATLLWKEYREHRAVWLALAVVAAGALIALPRFLEPETVHRPGFHDMLAIIAILLAWTYGMVCGAMLLAGEHEAGTQTFLDTLPRSRLRLWLGKCLVGGLFVGLYLVLIGLLTAWQLPDGSAGQFALPITLPAAGLTGYAWGLFCSALSRSVLNAFGLAVLLQPFAFQMLFLLLLPPLAVASLVTEGFTIAGPALVAALALLVTVPLPLSALVYSRPDRRRVRRFAVRTTGATNWLGGWRVAFWLSWRQMRGLLPWLGVFCIAAGLLIRVQPLIFWPLVTLAVGTFCGVAAFRDEQNGPRRFLGDQRFPLGRIWLVKVGLSLGLAFLSLGVLLLPTLAVLFARWINQPTTTEADAALEQSLSSALLTHIVPPGLFFLTWALYGFSAGHLCGLLFRKPLVGLVVGFGLAVLLAAVWAPSFITGGLNAWQVCLIPAVLLGCARLVLWDWAADRIASWRVFHRLLDALILCVGLTAAGLWYRVVEVPDFAEPAGFAEFVRALPTLEENEAGRLIRGACGQVGTLSQEWSEQQPTRPLFPGKRLEPHETFPGQANLVIERGWPAGQPELADWLDKVFAANWWKSLAEAATKPVGLVEDLRNSTVTTRDRTTDPARTAAVLLAARGLQQQAMRNDPAVFVDHLEAGLALARNLENNSTVLFAIVGRVIESVLLTALERWLEALDGRADLLRRVAALLDKHRQAVPTDPMPHRMAEYLVARNSLEDAADWLQASFLGGRRSAGPVDEAALLVSAWRLPWEQERQQRLLRFVHWGTQPFDFRSTQSVFFTVPGMFRGADRLQASNPRRLAALDAARLMVALRRYQAEQGKPADVLTRLVPAYLEGIPFDPFDGQPFRYRLSRREEIAWPEPDQEPGGAAEAGGADVAPGDPAAPPPGPLPGERTRKVPAGQGILWSVGEDRSDDGGKRQGLRTSHHQITPGEDLIFLVPLPAAKK